MNCNYAQCDISHTKEEIRHTNHDLKKCKDGNRSKLYATLHLEGITAGDVVSDLKQGNTVDQNDECERDGSKVRRERGVPSRVRAPRNIELKFTSCVGGRTGKLLAVAEVASGGGALSLLKGFRHLTKVEEGNEGSGEGQKSQEEQEEAVDLLGKGKSPDLESAEEESKDDDQQQGNGQDAENQEDVDHIEDLANGATDGVLFPVAQDGSAGLESLSIVLEGASDALDIIRVSGDVQEGRGLLKSSSVVSSLGGVCGEESQRRIQEGGQKPKQARQGEKHKHAVRQLTLLGDGVEGGVERNNVQRESGERKEESERVRSDELHSSDRGWTSA